ncbi:MULTISPECIES: nitrate- and nitrite sensing domain-containing protein [unclassified Streptomyces]|uniref:sensor histidine kinase n=1 Tax=unclassified Streptomyces TaxID=2593676 RepID=UPI001BE9C4BC|nr:MULTISPECIES: nitrate- and nitrite sensing domain-containing protein [unclassified Streptomyces]MBT2407314.1 nitrate- and nitrite sensing domain-containing protein [Streptomyces sp. ISL-21]MBT2613389.1 nitrate- and nitrite sensing domain-containing protein [Streptomyces sp. ISL-87]
MRFRGKSIRRKIVALLLVPLVSLTALWGFATVITGRQAVQLLDVAYVIDKVGYPIEDVVRVIQKERRQTLVVVGDPRSSVATAELAKSRAATDAAVESISVNARDPEVIDELSPNAAQRLRSILDAFHGIAAVRVSVDQNSLDPSQALELYNRLVDPCYEFLMNLHALESVEMDKQGRALVGITRARETLSREDAVIASALAARSVSAADIRHVSDFAANRTLLYEFNLAILPGTDREHFEAYWTSPATKPLREAEERFVAAGAGKNPRSVTTAEWDAAATKVLDDLATMGTAAGDSYQKRVEPVAMDVLVQAAVAGILGFIALIVSLVLSVRIGRDLVRDLSRLRKDAHEASGVRLPSVMRRLAAGELVDIETEAPHLEFEKDEVGQVGQALNTLQRAAVEAAVKQAELRRGVSEVFVNLARRNQVLLHRQLTLLDTMERRTEDTEELADLFRLDHMTTRMRRHAEGLVILSGAAPSRQWRKPVQLMDVVRAAVAEVEDYERIEVRRLPRLGIEGPAVADVTHLIAELLENATVFSPPHTAVQVHGERVANGFTLEIHDRGLGMTPEALLDANLRLAETPEFELSDTDRLGLFVVSRLAQRHGVRVVLQHSPYGGTTAVVFLPADLLTEAPETNGTGIRLAEGKRSGRPAPAAVGRASAGHPLPPGALHGPVELEAPLTVLGLGGIDGTAGLDALDEAPAGITGLTGVRGRPPMATLDDETPPNGTPRSALLGLRPAERPHPGRNPQRGGAWKGDRIGGDRTGGDWTGGDRNSGNRNGGDGSRGSGEARIGGDWTGGDRKGSDGTRGIGGDRISGDRTSGDRTGSDGTRGIGGDRISGDRTGSDGTRGGADRIGGDLDREPLAPTGPVRRERPRADAVRVDGPRASGAVPLPRRRPTPTLVAEHGRRVEPRPVSAVPQPAPESAPESASASASEEARAKPAKPVTPGQGTGTGTGPGGLPRRVRQASLAPQLKNAPAPAPAEAAAEQLEDRDAEDVRRRMSALQRGWTAGRIHYAQQQSETAAGTSAATGPANENEGDGR